MRKEIKSKGVHIISPENYISEKKFVFDVLFKDYLNYDYVVEFSDEADGYTFSVGDNEVQLPDIFFSTHYQMQAPIEPKVALISTGVEAYNLASLPGWYYDFESQSDQDGVYTDVVGMAFFLMSGFADINFSNTDKHNRNKGVSSFVVRNNLIDRPIIQEWFTVIAAKLFGSDQLKTDVLLPKYTKHISHDVDQPFEYLNYTVNRLMKRILGDIISRKSISLATQRLVKYLKVKQGLYSEDPYNNFGEINRVLSKAGVLSTFFFIAGKNQHEYDVSYNIEHEAIKEILNVVHKAGHKIGIHPGYLTLNDPDLLRYEVNKLQKVTDEIGLDIKITECRKHYLRWDWKGSVNNLAKAGIEHDYTVGYADRAGFRVGVAFPYRAFNWQTKKSANLKIHPLIVMEASLLGDKYMGLSIAQSWEKILLYHNILTQLGGEFVLLWHNNRLTNQQEMELFTKFISL